MLNWTWPKHTSFLLLGREEVPDRITKLFGIHSTLLQSRASGPCIALISRMSRKLTYEIKKHFDFASFLNSSDHSRATLLNCSSGVLGDFPPELGQILPRLLRTDWGLG